LIAPFIFPWGALKNFLVKNLLEPLEEIIELIVVRSILGRIA